MTLAHVLRSRHRFRHAAHGWPPGTRTSTLALFALVVLVMGGGYVAVRVVVAAAPPLFLGALRFDLTAVALLGAAALTGADWWPRTRADRAAVVVLGVFVFGGAIALLFLGQRGTTAAVAAIAMCLGPALTAAFARVLLPAERLSRRGLFGVLLGLAGALLLAQPGSAGTARGSGLGVVLVLCAAASGSLGSVLLGRLGATASPVVQAGWGALLGGLLLHAASAAAGEQTGSIAWTPGLVGLLAYLALVVGGGGYVALLVLLRRVGPTRTSLTSYGSPVAASVFGALLLGESPTATALVGFAVIAAGFALLAGPLPRRDRGRRSDRSIQVDFR